MEINLLLVSTLVVGLVEVMKNFKLNKQWNILLTFVISAFLVTVASPYIGITDVRAIIINSIVVALQAMGLYSGGKAIAGK